RPLSPPGAPDADAQWRRILTDPVSGMVTDYGTIRYRPPVALADLIRARDGRCFEPSCTVTAWRADLDHLRPSPAGPSPAPNADGATSAGNLAAACRRHHRTKQAPGWAVRADPGAESAPGALTWTTPTGHTYTRHPEPPLPWLRHPALDPPESRPVLHRTHALHPNQFVSDDACTDDSCGGDPCGGDPCGISSDSDQTCADESWPESASAVEAMIEELLRSITFEYAGTGDVSGPAGEPDAGPPHF
ncbi:MAG TPA: HNH endonuclease signature motif containing protein, partial [Actinomycetales bacterium]